MPTTNTHRFWDTQPTTSAALLRIQLRIAPMMSGNASAAFTPNLPGGDAMAVSLFLIQYFKPFSSLGGGLPDVPSVLPPGSNASTKTPIAIPIAVSMEAILIPLLAKQHSDLFS